MSDHRPLTYCLNVHPGETWQAQCAAVEDHALSIGSQFRPRTPFGLGLRLSGQAARTLSRAPEQAECYRAAVRQTGAYLLTVNAFPFGQFHGKTVKDIVYRPDWADRQRVAYTCDVVAAVALLAEPGSTVSVSTAPLTFKGWDGYAARGDAGFKNLVECLVASWRIAETHNVEIVLCMEPEPFCYPETTVEMLAVWQRVLTEGVDPFCRQTGLCAKDAEAQLRRFFGICFDTAHQAVEFECLDEALLRLRAAGVRVGKIQLSAALEARGDVAQQALVPFAEQTYLHQTSVQQRSGELLRFRDLSEALAQVTVDDAQRWRVHYHVPLFVEPSGSLSSTSALLRQRAFRDAVNQLSDTHLEVETYTWDVWKRDAGVAQALDEGILKELRWVDEHLGASQLGAQGCSVGRESPRNGP